MTPATLGEFEANGSPASLELPEAFFAARAESNIAQSSARTNACRD